MEAHKGQFGTPQLSELQTMPIGRLLGTAGRFASARFSKVDTGGIPHTGWLVLSKLHEHGELAQGDVASRVFLTPATLTSVVDGLEATGLLTRARDEVDRRVVRLRITDLGRTRVQELREQIEAQMNPLFAGMTAKDSAVVRRVLINTIHRAIELDNEERTS